MAEKADTANLEGSENNSMEQDSKLSPQGLDIAETLLAQNAPPPPETEEEQSVEGEEAEPEEETVEETEEAEEEEGGESEEEEESQEDEGEEEESEEGSIDINAIVEGINGLPEEQRKQLYEELKQSGLKKQLERINQLTAEKKTAQEQLDQLKAQVGVNPVSPYAHILDPRQLQQQEAELRQNLDAATKVLNQNTKTYVDDEGEEHEYIYEEGGKYYTRDDVSGWVDGWRNLLERAIPERKSYIAAKAKWDSKEEQAFPWLKDKSSELYKEAEKALSHPVNLRVAAMSPAGRFGVLAITEKLMALEKGSTREKELAKGLQQLAAKGGSKGKPGAVPGGLAGESSRGTTARGKAQVNKKKKQVQDTLRGNSSVDDLAAALLLDR